MTTHTPGPWTVTPHIENGETWRTYYVGPSDGGHVGVVSSSCTARPADEADANARLIAAAPALLEACEGMLREFGNQRMDVKRDYHKIVQIEAAKTAIAQATRE